jgi:two-component system uhpT operon response regulator UhpA
MPKTAHVHRANIYRKLAVSNNFELLKIAVSAGIISFEELAE